MGEFLDERDFIGWSAPEGFPASLDPAGLFTQDAPNGLEVALAESRRKPTAPDLRRAWSKRRATMAATDDPAEQAEGILGVIRSLGLEPYVPPQSLPEITDDVHLVCWLALT